MPRIKDNIVEASVTKFTRAVILVVSVEVDGLNEAFVGAITGAFWTCNVSKHNYLS